MIVKDYTVSYWSDLFAQRAPSLPFARIAAWMAEESEGFPQALGTRYEVGIVQIDLQDGPKYGGTTDNLHTDFCASATSSQRVRDLTDDEETLQVDVARDYITALLQTAMNQTDGLGWSDDDVWCLVKLHHALPALAGQAFSSAKAQGQASSWDAFRSYTESLPAGTYPGWGAAAPNGYYPFARFFNNSEKVGKLGLSGLLGDGGFIDTDLLLLLAALGFAAWLLLRYVG